MALQRDRGGRGNLGFDGTVEIVEKQEMEEIGEGEAFLRVVTLMQNPLYEPARIGRGAAYLFLVLHQEPKELISRHVIPTTGEPRERFLHVGRRTHLSHLELPAEPKHLVLVARHFFPTQQFFHSPTLSLFVFSVAGLSVF